MPGGLDQQALSLVFKTRPDIIAGIKEAADSPARIKLFNNITKHVHDQLTAASEEPSAKRRKIDGGSAGLVVGGSSRGANGHVNGASAASEQVQLEIKEISLSIPQRKKFDLCFTKNHLYARAPNTTAPVEGIVYAWADIEHIFYLPVPEKTQPQHNYVIFPRNTALAYANKNATPPAVEPLVFTVPATAPKAGTIGGAQAAQASAVSDTYNSLFHWVLGNHLRAAGNKVSIVAADPKVFHSAQRGDGRGQPVHIRAFRGSKDGYLFFLPTGILWGFKKPLLFMPLDRITATSYTSVLQRTFNIVVEVDLSGTGYAAGGDAGETEEIEFGMLDQEDFGNIDESYVKRHRLQDRSMADTRKAKREMAENGKVKKEGGDVKGDVEMEDDGLTEIQRAEQLLQDEEDENEEDYDPDAEEDDDGEGSSDDDEDGEGGDDDEDDFDEDEDDE